MRLEMCVLKVRLGKESQVLYWIYKIAILLIHHFIIENINTA